MINGSSPLQAQDALVAQTAFLSEIDRLKRVDRQSLITGRSRRENSAEHSWHLAMFAMILGREADGVDLWRVVQMLLVHDIVEIDVGDTPIHASNRDLAAVVERELEAARRIFGLLPPSQGQEILALWQEFEAGQSADACFAKALDRLQPLLLNTLTEGGTWTENGVGEDQVVSRYGPTIAAGSAALWEHARHLVSQHFASRQGCRSGEPPAL